jgi:cryptochrome
MKQQRSIHWFRKGLRLHDNPSLLAACESASHFYPVFFLDPYFAKKDNYRVGINRWRFLLESLQDLDASLRKLNSRFD